jgi:hypothetical protein
VIAAENEKKGGRQKKRQRREEKEARAKMPGSPGLGGGDGASAGISKPQFTLFFDCFFSFAIAGFFFFSVLSLISACALLSESFD